MEKTPKDKTFPVNVKGEERNMERKTITRRVINVYKHQRSNETEIASGLLPKEFFREKKELSNKCIMRTETRRNPR